MTTARRGKTSQGIANPLRTIRQAGAKLFRDPDGSYRVEGRPDLTATLDRKVLDVALLPRNDADQDAAVADLLDGIEVVLCTDDKAATLEVWALVENARLSGCLALDTETMVRPEFREPVEIALTLDGRPYVHQPTDGAAGYALNPRRAAVRLLQAYAGEGRVVLFDMAAIGWPTVAPLLEGVPTLAMFNAVFDVKMILAGGGPEPLCRIFDTMTAMRLVDGTRPNMAAAAKVLLGVDLPKELGAADWSASSLPDDQIRYAALDAVITWHLWQAQRERFDGTDENAQEIVDEPIIAVARMELAGMPLDAPTHRVMIQGWQKEHTAALAALNAAWGASFAGPPSQARVRTYLEWVLDDEALEAWPRTGKTGALSGDAKHIKAHGGDVPGVPELLTLRQWDKALSTYGQALLDRVDEGRLYAGFLIAGATTGRASSREPNLQNMPRRSRELADFRRIFAAPDGRAIVAADYSQIELRCLAAISGDETMNDLYDAYGAVYKDPVARAAYDVHTRTASAFSDHAEPTKEERSIAKAINFSLSYGAGPGGVAGYAKGAYGVDMDLDEAREKIAAFRETYPDVAAWQDQHIRDCRKQGFVSTVGGRRWRWEWRAKSWDDPSLDDLWEWQLPDALSGFTRNYALNHPIQGTCAEIMWLALAYCDRSLRRLDARIVAVVHDEIVVECRAGRVPVGQVSRILVREMTRAWREFFPDAPYLGLVDVSSGPTWADAH